MLSDEDAVRGAVVHNLDEQLTNKLTYNNINMTRKKHNNNNRKKKRRRAR